MKMLQVSKCLIGLAVMVLQSCDVAENRRDLLCGNWESVEGKPDVLIYKEGEAYKVTEFKRSGIRRRLKPETYLLQEENGNLFMNTGFRIDVAAGMVKDLSAPYRPAAQIPWWPLPEDGSHPLFDRDEVHDIYRHWRAALDSYDPPRFAVAEAGVTASRRPAYAASLGQAFNFQMQDADWSAHSFGWAIDAGLADEAACGSTTWVLGCHDSPRAAARYGFDLADDVAAALARHLAPLGAHGTPPRTARMGPQSQIEGSLAYTEGAATG